MSREEEDVQVIAGEDEEDEEEMAEESTLNQTITTLSSSAIIIPHNDQVKNMDGEDDGEEEEPQEIEGEDDEEDEDEEMEEEQQLTVNVTTTSNTIQNPVSETEATVSHIRSLSNVSEGTTTNTSITTNPQISDTNSESATPITPSTTSLSTAASGAALVEGATRKLSTFWKSFKSNVATVVTTTNQAIASTTGVTTTLTGSSTTEQNVQTSDSSIHSNTMEKTIDPPLVNNDPSDEPQPPGTPSHTQTTQPSGSPSYSTYFSGVLNKLKSELQTSTLAEPVEKLKKALSGEPTHDPKNPNQIVLRITHRMKDLKHSNEQLEQTIHNKYSNTLEHINVELMRLSNSMTRTLHNMQQTQLQLKKSNENLSNLVLALDSFQSIENKESTN